MRSEANFSFSRSISFLVQAASLVCAGFFILALTARAQETDTAAQPTAVEQPAPPGETAGQAPGETGEIAPVAQGEAPPGTTPGTAPGVAGPTGEAPAAPSAEVQAELAKIVLEAEKPPEVTQDETVSDEDLGSSRKPLILPDNPLYVFKGWGRGLQKALTFDPVKKAELELKHANAKLVEVETLVEKRGDDVNPEVLEKVLASAEKDFASIAEKKESIKESKTDDLESVHSFTDKLIGDGFKHQKFLTKLEQKLPSAVKERVATAFAETRNTSLEESAELVSSVVETPEEFTETITAALENQSGSEFKNFKNLEILSALEEKLPEEALKGVAQAKENAFKRLHDNLSKLSEEDQKGKFGKYIEFSSGNAGEHLGLVDEFKSALDADEATPEFFGQLNVIKEKAFKKFEDQARQFTDPAARAELFRPFKGGKLEDLRIVSQLKEKLGSDIPDDLKQEVEKAHSESFGKFKEKFASDPKALETASKAEGLFKKFQENPDAVDFKVMAELRDQLDPEQKKFVESMEEEIGGRFAEKFAAQGEAFGQFFADPTDPRGFQALEGLKDRLPEAARAGIERMMEAQRDNFREHVRDLEDPFILSKIQSVVGGDADLKKSFEQGDVGFFKQLESRRSEFETKFREEAQQRFEKFQGLQQGLSGPPGGEGGGFAPGADFGLPPEALEKFREVQEKFKSGGFGPPGGFGPGGFGPPGAPGAQRGGVDPSAVGGGETPGGGFGGGQFPGGGATGGQFPGGFGGQGGQFPGGGSTGGQFPGGGSTGGQFPGGFGGQGGQPGGFPVGSGGFSADDFLNVTKFFGPPPTSRNKGEGGTAGSTGGEGGSTGSFPTPGGDFLKGLPEGERQQFEDRAKQFQQFEQGGRQGAPPGPFPGGSGQGDGNEECCPAPGEVPRTGPSTFPGGGVTGGQFPGGGTTGGQFPSGFGGPKPSGGPSRLERQPFGAPSTGGDSGPGRKQEEPSFGSPLRGFPDTAPSGRSGGESGPSGQGGFSFPGSFPSTFGGESKTGESGGSRPFFTPPTGGDSGPGRLQEQPSFGAPLQGFPGGAPSGGESGGPFFAPGGTSGGHPAPDGHIGPPPGGSSGGFGSPSGGSFAPPPSGFSGPSLPPPSGGTTGGFGGETGGTSGGFIGGSTGGGTFSPPPSGDTHSGGGTFSPPPSGDGGGGGGAPPPSGGGGAPPPGPHGSLPFPFMKRLLGFLF